MTEYQKIGFKAGIEIHQQLETGKLFCRCPSIVHDKNPDIHLKRRLTARAGEGGKIDVAALAEMRKAKEFSYEACSTSSCLVEADEEPPLLMNEEALQIVIQVAQLVHAKIIDEIQVMRKIVIDGSNVSGFQRTALVAVNGYIETSRGRVSIPGVNIEEESAKKIETTEQGVKYRLDRLGVSLIEISTGPELADPEHVKEAAEKIGMILRSTGKMKRGIGTIRQDVNVSIAGGARTEIKGFQDLRSIPQVIVFEIERQQKLISEGKKVESEVRKAEPDLTTSFLRPMPGAARMYPETDIPPVLVSTTLLREKKIELIDDLVQDLVDTYKLDKDIAANLVKMQQKDFFKSLCAQHKNLKPSFIADTLLSAPKQVKQKFNVEIKPTEQEYEILFEALDMGKIAKESILDILKEHKEIRNVIKKYELMSDEELERQIKKIILENKNMPAKALIGKAMAQLRGKAEGRKIVDMLERSSK
ncbi:Glu-tRNA(Gln) amidotransferase subunit GatE [Candidatus Woesearchaeota archaeon]|nr:Glu-tRNA(Gln) amidotransferase subunit GatE [Candidatus Woesearchaeota archaeon]